MSKKYHRECISICCEEKSGGASALVVSSDEDSQSFRSEMFKFADIEVPPKVCFDVDEWLTSMWVSKTGTHFLCGALGDVYSNASGKYTGAKVSDHRLFKVWGLDDTAVFAVGSDGACVAYDGKTWKSLNEGLSGHLYAIGGSHKDNLLCVGDGGFVARFDGKKWTTLKLKTKAAFRAVYVLENEEAYLCGLDGACFRLKGESLETIQTQGQDFYSVACYKNEIYFGSLASGVFKVEKDKLVLVKDKAKGGHMTAQKDYLWTCGLEQAVRFDGTTWRKVDFI